MNRVLVGAATTLLVMVAAGAGLWWSGWMHFGAMGADMTAGHEMAGTTEGATDSALQEDHAGTMAGDESAAVVDHSGHASVDDEDAPTAPRADPSATAAMPEGAVMIPPEQQQLIGVRTTPVVEEAVTREIRTVGRVEFDETRVAHIHTKVTGWIEKLYVDYTGKRVEQGQPLLEIYSPELVATQEEYLLALRAQESLGASEYQEVAATSRSLLDATRRRLLLWDVTSEQIEQLEARREPQTTLALHSPIVGFVIHKNAYEGLHVVPGTELFSIADLSQVWVIADIYESDLPLVRPGQSARISLSYTPGERYVGTVDYVYPYLEGETRTARVRIVLANPDGILKPDMYANVELTSQLGRSLVVPEDAVIDTGERQVVFLALEGAHFLAREIRTGIRFDGKLQVLEGLEIGDVVVSGAAFLVDSESKLRSAIGMAGHQH